MSSISHSARVTYTSPHYSYLVNTYQKIERKLPERWYSELNKNPNSIGQEGWVTQYQTDHAEGAEDELPYIRHQESAMRDP